jgi:hypothetical protein
MTQTLIYIIPAVALIAILWSSVIKKRFTRKELDVVPKSEFGNIMTKNEIMFALTILSFANHGVKQDETVFQNQGKQNAQSDSYKKIQSQIFT